MWRNIIWDWNGTLLDDSKYVYEIVNKMLRQKGSPSVSFDQYKNIFSFPIKEYYRKIGFKFESESEYYSIVNEFNALYSENAFQCELAQGAKSILKFYKEQECSQFLLSGLNKNELVKSVNIYHIADFFKEIVGSNGKDAADKLINCKKLFELINIRKEDTIFIGDTISDYELARDMGCRCILTTGGHQAENVLTSSNVTLINNLIDLKTL